MKQVYIKFAMRVMHWREKAGVLCGFTSLPSVYFGSAAHLLLISTWYMGLITGFDRTCIKMPGEIPYGAYHGIWLSVHRDLSRPRTDMPVMPHGRPCKFRTGPGRDLRGQPWASRVQPVTQYGCPFKSRQGPGGAAIWEGGQKWPILVLHIKYVNSP